MDFKERILTALNHEEADRVPVMGLIAEPAASNKILGKPPLYSLGTLLRLTALQFEVISARREGSILSVHKITG